MTTMRIAFLGFLLPLAVLAVFRLSSGDWRQPTPTVHYVRAVDGRCLKFTGDKFGRVWMTDAQPESCEAK